jgi:hypothetical protein
MPHVFPLNVTEANDGLIPAASERGSTFDVSKIFDCGPRLAISWARLRLP